MVGRRWCSVAPDHVRIRESCVRSSSPKARSKKRACEPHPSSPVSAATGEPADGCIPARKRAVSSTIGPDAESGPAGTLSCGGRVGGGGGGGGGGEGWPQPPEKAV